jgi:hypothetical protein
MWWSGIFNSFENLFWFVEIKPTIVLVAILHVNWWIRHESNSLQPVLQGQNIQVQ